MSFYATAEWFGTLLGYSPREGWDVDTTEGPRLQHYFMNANKGNVINIQVRHQLHIDGQLFEFPSKEAADEAWKAYQQTHDVWMQGKIPEYFKRFKVYSCKTCGEVHIGNVDHV